jgi:hypothetical protein
VFSRRRRAFSEAAAINCTLRAFEKIKNEINGLYYWVTFYRYIL